MIILIHNCNKIKKIDINNTILEIENETIIDTLFNLANKYPNEKIIWIHELLFKSLNIEYVKKLIIQSNEMHSFATDLPFLNKALGYIDQNAILKFNRNVVSQTWQMSTDVGVVSAELLNSVKEYRDFKIKDFGYFLNSIAQRFLLVGLFSKSNPNLLKSDFEIVSTPTKLSDLFKFVRQHYGLKQVVFLFISLLIFEKKFYFYWFDLVFLRKYKLLKKSIFNYEIDTKDELQTSVDVIIPTIGREKELYGVFECLRNQTYLPKQVVLVEQNPIQNSKSNLDWINNEEWPFQIEHIFIHQTGVCNARNIALSKVKSEWVFMCDDDNLFENTLLHNVLLIAKKFNYKVVSLAYPQVNETIDFGTIHQTTIFGSGNSIVNSSLLENVSFDSNYEFCYGEDFDFGMQLRNQGTDVIYLPNPVITHLKAPFGGFRTKPVLPWENDLVLPNPSPTILLNFIKYKTQEQLSSYKVLYFYNKLKKSKFNFFKAYKNIKLQWNASEVWANRLMNND